MLVILLLILLAILFLVAELVLLPGLSVAGVLSLICGGSAIYRAFTDFGWEAGVVVTLIELVLALATIVFSLRAKTWQRFALKQQVDSSAGSKVEHEVRVGACGRALSRLSPMGSVEIDGKIYEAKLLSGYADPQTPVEVVGFENTSVIEKIIK